MQGKPANALGCVQLVKGRMAHQIIILSEACKADPSTSTSIPGIEVTSMSVSCFVFEIYGICVFARCQIFLLPTGNVQDDRTSQA